MDNEVEVTVCDICGDAGQKRKNLLAICCKCPTGAEHTYCMREMREKLPEGDWMCEECTMRSECQESGCPVNLNSLERKTEGKRCARGDKRRAGKLAVEIDGKRRALNTRTMDPSLKKLGKEKVEASLPVYGSRETPKLLAQLVEESLKFDFQTEIAPHDKCKTCDIAPTILKGQTPKQENCDAEDVELLHWGAVATLYLLSKGLTKI